MIAARSILYLTDELEILRVILSILIILPFPMVMYYIIKLVRTRLYDINALDKKNDDQDDNSDDEKHIPVSGVHNVMTDSDINKDEEDGGRADTMKLHQTYVETDHMTVDNTGPARVEMMHLREGPEIDDDKSASLKQEDNSSNDDQDPSESEF